MPFFDAHKLHIDAALSNISLAYKNGGFIADSIMPRVKVNKLSDKYKVYDTSNMKIQSTLRKDKATANNIIWDFATDGTYRCEGYAQREFVSDKDRANADPAIKPDTDAVEMCTDLIALDREQRVASALTAVANITTYKTCNVDAGFAYWDSYNDVDSDPLKHIAYAQGQIWANTLKAPNVIVLPYSVALYLANHPKYLERTKYVENMASGDPIPTSVLGMKVLVAGAGKDTAKKGQTASFSGLWSDYVLIAYVEPNPGLRTLTLGFSPLYEDRYVTKYYIDERKCDAIEVEETIDEVVGTAACGYLLVDTLE